MKRIPLTQGKFAIVDDDMYEYLNQWKWHATSTNGGYYAVRSTRVSRISMHREILRLRKGDGIHTDHKNRNTLDNRKCNLRACTCHENNCNRVPRTNTSSQFKGVYRCRNRWEAGIRKYGKRIYLGKFISEIQCAKAYDRAAKELFGEFAWLNFPSCLLPNNISDGSGSIFGERND